MSMITEFAAHLGLAPVSAANPGAYATYIASLVVEFGAGASLLVILGLRFGRSLAGWVGGLTIAPQHLFKLAIPLACLVTSAGFLAMDIR